MPRFKKGVLDETLKHLLLSIRRQTTLQDWSPASRTRDASSACSWRKEAKATLQDWSLASRTRGASSACSSASSEASEEANRGDASSACSSASSGASAEANRGDASSACTETDPNHTQISSPSYIASIGRPARRRAWICFSKCN